MFGYYIAQANGPVGNIDLLSGSNIHNHIIINPSTHYKRNLSAVNCKLDEMPFLPESIDVMVLFHALEFSRNATEILQETYNALINGGYLIILGFNPRSLWGLSKFLKYEKKGIWSGRWITPSKLRSKLLNIGFSVGDYQTFYFRPPNKDPEKMLFLEGIGQIFWPYCGASYILVAHKTTTILTPINELKSLIKQSEMAKVLPKSTPRITQ